MPLQFNNNLYNVCMYSEKPPSTIMHEEIIIIRLSVIKTFLIVKRSFFVKFFLPGNCSTNLFVPPCRSLCQWQFLLGHFSRRNVHLDSSLSLNYLECSCKCHIIKRRADKNPIFLSRSLFSVRQFLFGH